MSDSWNASRAWLRLRSLSEPAVLVALTAVAIALAEVVIPHPLGWHVISAMHVMNLVPAFAAAVVGAALRPRWDAAYAEAQTSASTLPGRLVFVLGVMAWLGLVGVAVWLRGAVPSLLCLVVAHAVAGSGLACAVHALWPRRPGAPMAVGAVVALALGLSSWWPPSTPVLGDSIGDGMLPAAVVFEVALFAIGVALLIGAGGTRR